MTVVLELSERNYKIFRDGVLLGRVTSLDVKKASGEFPIMFYNSLTPESSMEIGSFKAPDNRRLVTYAYAHNHAMSFLAPGEEFVDKTREPEGKLAGKVS